VGDHDRGVHTGFIRGSSCAIIEAITSIVVVWAKINRSKIASIVTAVDRKLTYPNSIEIKGQAAIAKRMHVL
jgi:hypothetical protein